MESNQETGFNVVKARGFRGGVLTLSANAPLAPEDTGALVIVTAPNLVISLPPTESGLRYTFVLAAAGLSAGAGLAISPNAVDKIMGNGFTSLDNKDALLAGAGDREGDSITIQADGVDGWFIVAVTGTWTREA